MANGQAMTIRREAHTAPGALVQHGEPIEPTNMAELRDFAKLAAESRFFGAENAGQALMIAMAGRDLGFSYTQAMRAFYNVKGKLTLSADGMVAACLQHRDVCEWFRPVEMTDTRCTWETKRVGMAEPVRYSFSMDDAQRAGLASDMYRKHPRRMLSARAKSYLARDVYPELLMGLVSEDEAHEIASSRPASPAVTYVVDEPAPVVVAPPPPAQPDWQAMAAEAASLLHRAETLAELDAAQAMLSKLAPKGSPHRKAVADLLASRRAELTPLPVEAADEPREGFE